MSFSPDRSSVTPSTQAQREPSDRIAANEKTANWINAMFTWALTHQRVIYFLTENPTRKARDAQGNFVDTGEINLPKNSCTEGLVEALAAMGIKDLETKREGKIEISGKEMAEYEAFKAQQAATTEQSETDEEPF